MRKVKIKVKTPSKTKIRRELTKAVRKTFYVLIVEENYLVELLVQLLAQAVVQKQNYSQSS